MVTSKKSKSSRQTTFITCDVLWKNMEALMKAVKCYVSIKVHTGLVYHEFLAQLLPFFCRNCLTVFSFVSVKTAFVLLVMIHCLYLLSIYFLCTIEK